MLRLTLLTSEEIDAIAAGVVCIRQSITAIAPCCEGDTAKATANREFRARLTRNAETLREMIGLPKED
jgi:hypothetical protein